MSLAYEPFGDQFHVQSWPDIRLRDSSNPPSDASHYFLATTPLPFPFDPETRLPISHFPGSFSFFFSPFLPPLSTSRIFSWIFFLFSGGEFYDQKLFFVVFYFYFFCPPRKKETAKIRENFHLRWPRKRSNR